MSPKVSADAAPVALKNQIRYKATILGPNESFSKEETEHLIEQTLLTQLEDEPILVSGLNFFLILIFIAI